MARLRSRFLIRRTVLPYTRSGEYSCPAFDVNTFLWYIIFLMEGINVKMNDYVSILNKASNYTEIKRAFILASTNVVIDIDDININSKY